MPHSLKDRIKIVATELDVPLLAEPATNEEQIMYLLEQLILALKMRNVLP
jgi:hypothetical protein